MTLTVFLRSTVGTHSFVSCKICSQMAEMLGDKRFAHIGRDPRFRQMKKQHHKVKIDNRFKGMFTDKRFKVKYMVDKRGRPVQTSSTDHLREYYHLSSSDDEETDGSGEEEGEVGLGKEGKNTDKKKREKRDGGKLKEKMVDRKRKVKGVEIKTKQKSVNVSDKLDDETDEDVTDEDEMQSKCKSGDRKLTVVKDARKRKNKSMTGSCAKINDEEGDSSGVSDKSEDEETDSSEDDVESSHSDPGLYAFFILCHSFCCLLQIIADAKNYYHP